MFSKKDSVTVKLIKEYGLKLDKVQKYVFKEE